jgi:hypothetical protein
LDPALRGVGWVVAGWIALAVVLLLIVVLR